MPEICRVKPPIPAAASWHDARKSRADRANEEPMTIRNGLLVASLTLLVATRVALADVGPAAPLLARLVQRALDSGQHAQLSPHLSVLLNVSHVERSTPIHQLGITAPGALWLIDVCDDDHTHIVLMRVAGGTDVAAYGMTPAGTLLKAVTYKVGGSTRLLSAGEAKAGFKGQLGFWIDKERELERAP
jgi:hypothetical protein